MAQAGFELEDDTSHNYGRHRWNFNGIKITHWHGNPCNLETLRDVMSGPMSLRGGMGSANAFESAVVLGTVAGKNLPSSSRDMRVVSTLILIRKAFEQLFPRSYLHAVGENCFDSTASLALTPYGKHQADFVNTQAIYARALTLALAFPLSQPAIAQLFYQQSDSPCLKLASAGNEVIPLGTATFAQVSRAVAKKYQGAVCTYIGIHFWFIPQNG